LDWTSVSWLQGGTMISRGGKLVFISKSLHDLSWYGEIVICTSFFSYGLDEGIGSRLTKQEDGKSSFLKEGYTPLYLWSSEYTKKKMILLTCKGKDTK